MSYNTSTSQTRIAPLTAENTARIIEQITDVPVSRVPDVEHLLEPPEEEEDVQQEQVTDQIKEQDNTPGVPIESNSIETAVATEELSQGPKTGVERKHGDTDDTDSVISSEQDQHNVPIDPALDNTAALLAALSSPLSHKQQSPVEPLPTAQDEDATSEPQPRQPPIPKMSNAPISYAPAKKKPRSQTKQTAKKTPRHTATPAIDQDKNSQDEETLPSPKPVKKQPHRQTKQIARKQPKRSAPDEEKAEAQPPASHSRSHTEADDDNPGRPWCWCKRPDDGLLMIACDQEGCAIEWYHAACVGVKVSPPEDKWLCPSCIKRAARPLKKRKIVKDAEIKTKAGAKAAARAKMAASKKDRAEKGSVKKGRVPLK